jgi:hypothetical protein
MRLTPDIDVVTLMATALSAKRRPASLLELVAAAELLQGFVPTGEKLTEAIERLSSIGLIEAAEDGFALTQHGQKIAAEPPKKADTEQRMAIVKDSLAAYRATGEHPAILLPQGQVTAAILAHKTSRRTPVKNLLMPRAKPDRHFKVEGRWRSAPAKQGRKP